MKRTTVICTLVAGAVAVAMPRPASAADGTNIVPRLTESVKDNWRKISALSSRAMTLRCERENLPDRAWIACDKESHGKLIHDKVLLIRELLLSTSAQDLLKEVDALDRKIAEIDRDIHKESAHDIFCPEDSGKGTLAKLRENRRGLVRRREEAMRVVSQELESLGLRLSGGAEQCLFLVDARDLVDVAIVAKGVGIVVERLRALMQSGDVVAAKRYYGMYLIMVEVQKACYDIYIEKSRTGEWRDKIAQLKAEATTLRQKALTSSTNMVFFTAPQRAAFARNAEVNAATLKAIDAYVQVLDQHEAVIRSKAEEAVKMLMVAENSYKTVALTEEFLSLAKANQDSFEALLELQLPPIEVFNDAALLAEFAAITRKLEAK